MKDKLIEELEKYSNDEIISLVNDNGKIFDLYEELNGHVSVAGMLHMKALITEIVTERNKCV